MATTRVKLHATSAAVAVLFPLRLFACGTWSEEAPPLLSTFLDRLPAKSFGHVYLETRRRQPAAKPDFAREVSAIGAAVRHEERASLLSRTEALLAGARDHYENGDWSNLLHDVRDLLASEASGDEAADYIGWRLAHAGWFKQASESKHDHAYPRRTPPDLEGTPEAIELEARAQAASPALQPHYLYLRGALEFRTGDRERSARWFRRVVDEHGDHPRAEIALFVAARCKLAQSRTQMSYDLRGQPVEPYEQQRERNRAHRNEARQLFETLLGRYPASRFTADVEGWLGALAYDEGDRTRALGHYIRQVEDWRHPEVAKSALFMCQKIIAGTAPEDAEQFRLIAEHPLVAIGATYLVSNASVAGRAADNYDYHAAAEMDARAREWRRAVLPRLGAEVAARAGLYDADAWPPRYLSILAHAASAAGNHGDALKITSIPSRQAVGSDDLLLARGVAFQRSGRAAEAIEAYRTLLKTHPQSPLARGVQLKLAFALLDNKQAGAALLELTGLQQPQAGAEPDATRFDTDKPYPPADTALDFTASPVEQDISGAERSQIVQLIDTIYNFAPLAEIARVLRDPGADGALKRHVSAVLAQRYLQQENFAEARKYLTPSQYTLFATRLEALTRDVTNAKAPAARAGAMMALADAWAAARGKLLRLPLESGEVIKSVYNDSGEEAGLRRRENARAIGIKDPDEELEGRDELQHARKWWMRAAAAAPRTPLAATAQWRALAAIPQLASDSDYAFHRAVESDAAARSRESYQRLRDEAPDSVEARRCAAYWSFPLRERRLHEEFVSYLPQWNSAIEEVGRMGYRHLDYGAFEKPSSAADVRDRWLESGRRWASIRERMIELYTSDVVLEAASLSAEVERLRDEARRAYTFEANAAVMAALDDIALFLKEANVTPETCRAYLELRSRHAAIYPEPPEWDQREAARAGSEARVTVLLGATALQSRQDYVDFIKAVRAGQETVSIPTNDFDKQGEPFVLVTKDYWALERAMRGFLEQYPSSRKREAARLLLARAVHWLTTPLLTTVKLAVDGAPPPEAASEDATVLNTYWREKFDAARALEPLDAYDSEFPKGQYAAEMRDYRAGAARLMGNWTLALDLTLEQLVDPEHPDLHREAAVRLANLFAELGEVKKRTELIGALRLRPQAVERLQQYLAQTWTHEEHPLRYLGAYLSDQLGFAYSPPAP